MKVFCTVGSTSFDKLIRTLTSEEVLQVLESRGYTGLALQIGNYTGNLKELPTSYHTMSLEYFRFKDSIAEDIGTSDLVISHAGAGSCLEVLNQRKPLVVVVNEDLMDNHQLELAQQLHDDGLVFMCTCRTLKGTLSGMRTEDLVELPAGNPELFVSFVNHIMSDTN